MKDNKKKQQKWTSFHLNHLKLEKGVLARLRFLMRAKEMNKVPVAENLIADIRVLEDTVRNDINLMNAFKHLDMFENSDLLTFSLVSSSNEQVVDATIRGNILRLTYSSYQEGASKITIRAMSQAGEFVETSFNVFVESIKDTSIQLRDLPDVRVFENTPNTLIDLSSLFTDVEEGENLALSVVKNTNKDLVDAEIDENELILNYAQNQRGQSYITIRATYRNHDYEESTFRVDVLGTDAMLLDKEKVSITDPLLAHQVNEFISRDKETKQYPHKSSSHHSTEVLQAIVDDIIENTGSILTSDSQKNDDHPKENQREETKKPKPSDNKSNLDDNSKSF